MAIESGSWFDGQPITAEQLDAVRADLANPFLSGFRFHRQVVAKLLLSLDAAREQQARIGDALAPLVSAVGADVKRYVAILDKAWPDWRDFATQPPMQTLVYRYGGWHHEDRLPDLSACILIKSARDKNEYVAWHEGIGRPFGVLTRAEALELIAAERVERCDRYGTTAMIGAYRWDRPGPFVQGRGIIPRDRVGEYAGLYLLGALDAAYALLDPFDDEPAPARTRTARVVRRHTGDPNA
jgi:hypothetical protein